MPEFANPFSGMIPDRKMTLRELIRALRLNIAAEYEAVHLYEAHADATDNPLAKKVLQDVANEEREHAGEFQQVINMLIEDEVQWIENGMQEVREMAAEIAMGKLEPATPAEKQAEEGEEETAPDVPVPTIGSMRQ